MGTPAPTESAPDAAAARATISEFATRFLFSFYFDRGEAATTADALIGDAIGPYGGGRPAGPLWERVKQTHLPHLYTDEFLDHVVRYLFPDAGPHAGRPECQYLRVNDKAMANWFKAAEVRLPHGRTLRVDPKVAVEAFVTSQGVGLLSVCLGVGRGPVGPEDVIEFNYRLSQFRRSPVTGLVKPHPSDDSKRFGALPPQAQAAIPPAPAPDAPFEERLTSPYGAFTLGELAARLIRSPLVPRVRPVEPRELSVYTVVRLPEVDFADPAVRTAYGPLLSGLAQVEERGHAGADPDNLSVPALVLNRRHWAAVGVLGSAHLVADQSDAAGSPKGFNEFRVQVVRDKYFVSFLVTMLQRMTLNRAVDEAAEIFNLPADDRAARTARLRQDLLRFGVGGQFNQISSRHAHHRYYQLCRTGLDVIPAWADVRAILAELDADRLAQEQLGQQKRLGAVADGVSSSVVKIEHLQSVVHVIEYLLGVVYGAHFFHMLLSENPVVKEVLEHHLQLPHDWYVTGVAALGGITGLLFVVIVDRIHWLEHLRREKQRAKGAEADPPA